MARMHIHIAVADLEANIRFYSALFGTEPSVTKSDYAKWELADPAVNFAISDRGRAPGLDHVGIQADRDEGLAALRTRLDAAEISGAEQHSAGCCYARSNKYWVQDPQGIPWEVFHTLESIPTFGDDQEPALASQDCAGSACCVPMIPAPFTR